GDLNNDNSIDSKDAVIVLKDYAQALVSGSSAFKAAGDVNKDGKEDSKDAVKILRYYAETLAGVYKGNIADFK
ncbi:MAG: dockerin type I domain-containing protein, partial [Oscillospiraceae bacterium]|nr:dockerin type I domain-containing protein [Oscillospiraceae bacterium]